MENEILFILNETGKLFWKFGIKSVSMDDIASELGISKKTLYKYFDNKEELVERVIDQELKKRRKAFGELMNHNLPAIDELLEICERVAEHIKSYNSSLEFDLKKYYPEVCTKVREEKREVMYNAVLKNLKKGIKEGVYRNDIDVEIITKLRVWNTESIINNDMFTIEQLVSRNVYQQIMLYHIRGIVNEKGNKYLEKKINELNQ